MHGSGNAIGQQWRRLASSHASVLQFEENFWYIMASGLPHVEANVGSGQQSSQPGSEATSHPFSQKTEPLHDKQPFKSISTTETHDHSTTPLNSIAAPSSEPQFNSQKSSTITTPHSSQVQVPNQPNRVKDEHSINSYAPIQFPSVAVVIEQTEDRRKRRKTTPPPRAEVIKPQADQRQPAIDTVYDKLLPEASRQTSLGHGHVQGLHFHQKQPKVAQDLDENAPMSTQVEPAAVKETSDHLGLGTVRSSKTGRQSEAGSPPKKLIKLRADGRLTSPKTKDASEKKSKRGRKKTSETPSPKTKIVVMRYDSGSETKSTVGESIDSILSGSSRARPVLAPKHVQMKVRPSEPPKPLHPLFRKKEDTLKVVEDQKAAMKPSPRKHAAAKVGTSPSRKALRRFSNTSQSGADRPVLSFRTKPKHAGSLRPQWPLKDMAHVRALGPGEEVTGLAKSLGTLPRRKLKSSAAHVPKTEEIITQCYDAIQSSKQKLEDGKLLGLSYNFGSLRTPARRVMTGKELQDAVLQELSMEQNLRKNELVQPSQIEKRLLERPATTRLFRNLGEILSSFDKFECEDMEWTQKYAPKSAADSLQPIHRLGLLHDWLRSLVVNSTDCANQNGKAEKPAKRRKKRKRASDLDDFVVSGDEGGSGIDDGSESEDVVFFDDNQAQSRNRQSNLRKLTPSSLSKTKAVLISGPHGCGKTASVYAVASELGFEVFEINSGTRRSGRDVLDRVGDMRKNHLVNQRSRSIEDYDETQEEAQENSLDVQEEIKSGRQSTMASFFTAAAPKKKSTKVMRTPKKKTGPKKQESKSPPRARSQKQSLVLLEEVDILFEEDRGFWATVIDFIQDSRRPVVMTCSDESLVPNGTIDSLSVLRMVPPPASLAIDYLSLVAASEGHLLSQSAISALYASHHNDLRASIKDLNFWCQMAIGDPKGGLNWMLLRSDAEACQNAQGEQVRVISDKTFVKYMGILPSVEDGREKHSIDKEVAALSDVITSWQFDVDEWLAITNPSNRQISQDSSEDQYYDLLQDADLAFDMFSLADLVPGLAHPSLTDAALDATLPEMTESTRSNYTDGIPLLQADLAEDLHGIYKDLALTLKVFGKALLSNLQSEAPASDHASAFNPPSLDTKALAKEIVAPKRCLEYRQKSTAATMENAFEPLSGIVDGPGTSKGSHITVLDGPVSIISTDIAPYVRAIVSFDIRLEQQRLILSNMLSEGGRGGKKQRTTRASRAALEGGSKSSTRRERWFPKDLNFPMVLKTGGEGWQDFVQIQTQKEHGEQSSYMGSRRSSLASSGTPSSI